MSERLRRLHEERGNPQTGEEPPGPPATARLRYERRSLHGDAVRAVGGLVLTVGPLIAIDALLAVDLVLGLCAAIFAVYLGRTLLRYRTEIRIDASGVEEQALGIRRIAWDGLNHIKLRYYSTKRGREGAGWLVLTLTGAPDPADPEEAGPAPRRGSKKIAVESTLERFDDLLAAVAATAVRRGVAMDETSVHNFAAAGQPLRLADGEASR